jgi:hypothetical protein
VEQEQLKQLNQEGKHPPKTKAQQSTQNEIINYTVIREIAGADQAKRLVLGRQGRRLAAGERL